MTRAILLCCLLQFGCGASGQPWISECMADVAGRNCAGCGPYFQCSGTLTWCEGAVQRCRVFSEKRP